MRKIILGFIHSHLLHLIKRDSNMACCFKLSSSASWTTCQPLFNNRTLSSAHVSCIALAC